MNYIRQTPEISPGRFIVSAGDVTLMVVADDPRTRPLIEQHLMDWIKSGYSIAYETDDQVVETSAPVNPFGATIKALKSAKRSLAPGRNARKRKLTAPAALIEESKWKAGDTVYLAWHHLSNAGRQPLTTYRLARGVVEEFRGGSGVRKTVGVRFNSDPTLTWLAPGELTRAAEAE